MRMYVVLTLVCVAPVLITLQIIKIHLYEGTPLREKGERQANTALVLPATRGAILDREGRSLAVNTARGLERGVSAGLDSHHT